MRGFWGEKRSTVANMFYVNRSIVGCADGEFLIDSPAEDDFSWVSSFHDPRSEGHAEEVSVGSAEWSPASDFCAHSYNYPTCSLRRHMMFVNMPNQMSDF